MSLKLLYCSVLCLLVLVVRSHSQLIHECADDQAEFSAGNWDIPLGTLYAVSTDDLPSIFQGLEFEIGIYYIEGIGSSRDFIKDYSFILPERPIYLYIKYYIHILRDIGQFVYVVPGFGANNIVILPVTYDFQWQEVHLEIDSNELPTYGLMMVSEANLQQGEFLLIEKLIVAQGDTISSIDEIRDLCPSKVPTTTTSTTTVTTTTSTTTATTTTTSSYSTTPQSSSSTTKVETTTDNENETTPASIWAGASGGLEPYQLALAIGLPALFLFALLTTLCCILGGSKKSKYQSDKDKEWDTFQQSHYPQAHFDPAHVDYNTTNNNYYGPSEKVNDILYPNTPTQANGTYNHLNPHLTHNNNNYLSNGNLDPSSRMGSGVATESSTYHGIASYDKVLPRLIKNE